MMNANSTFQASSSGPAPLARCYAAPPMTEKKPPRKRRIGRAVLFVLCALAVLVARPAERHLRAASLLLRFADADARGFLPEYGKRELEETDIEVPAARGAVRGRIYAPKGVEGAPGIVIVHGVHRLAIDEPRLMRFSRSIASAGFVVLTPEVKEIADYRIDAASIETIGAAAHALRDRLGGRRVGVMGMSFAGGLGLRAAANPDYSKDIGFVVAIGAHHDMRRVLEFFSTNQVKWADGHVEPLTAHPYGALVLLHSHLEGFVPAAEVTTCRTIFRLWLWEKPEEARALLKDLSPETAAKIQAILEGKADVAALVREIARDEKGALSVSPAGHLDGLRAPVFLLHGAGDTVIPAAETSWLAKEVSPEWLRDAVVSPAIEHVEFKGEPTMAQQWEVVRFMAGVLAEAEDGGGEDD
jgi:pimeloyl-ACP methyl ester carboxylesterase